MKRHLVECNTVWYGRHVRGCRARIVLAMLLAIAFSVAPLRAAEPPADAGQAVVVFAIDPRSTDAPAMIDAVRAHLTGLPVRLVVDSAARSTAGSAGALDLPLVPSGRVIGTISIDPATRGEWIVSFTEPAFDATLVRRIKLRPQGTLVALEEAAIVIRSMVEALLDGGHVGIAKPPRPSETPPRASRESIAISAGYVGTTYAREVGWQSGVSLGLRWFRGELYVGGTYDIFPWIETSASPASVRLVRHPGALVVGYQGGARVAAVAELGFLADYVWRYTGGTESGLIPTADRGRWSFGVALHAGISWSPLPRIHFTARGGVDLMLNPYAYVAQQPTAVSPAALITPSPIRPRLDLGVVVDVW